MSKEKKFITNSVTCLIGFYLSNIKQSTLESKKYTKRSLTRLCGKWVFCTMGIRKENNWKALINRVSFSFCFVLGENTGDFLTVLNSLRLKSVFQQNRSWDSILLKFQSDYIALTSFNCLVCWGWGQKFKPNNDHPQLFNNSK